MEGVSCVFHSNFDLHELVLRQPIVRYTGCIIRNIVSGPRTALPGVGSCHECYDVKEAIIIA
ncbi:uncharacterized protein PHALS_04754 [Plasmopara halstedii]|uniref:Uncharacterized protein n=1 Tax=Plasmopara halstedii TaxID=4781 RepID=A0A0N7L7N9_PLAHL|nr:uncharacterized protein PHALS_04754 [Plasmopara halstedii]CEG47603.1 hypothetical protein PHALS_04754 [Plasmopara halstedii]|eukprot:XP_024583972.1 hypothetical protein PHALS_04754 [Plasmopara halstedii]